MLTFKTEDGYTFVLLADGSVSDHQDPSQADMSWPSLEEFFKSMADEGMKVRVSGNGFAFNAKPK
jgi:hypothetical protein